MHCVFYCYCSTVFSFFLLVCLCFLWGFLHLAPPINSIDAINAIDALLLLLLLSEGNGDALKASYFA